MSLRKWMTGRVEMRDSSSDEEIVRRKKGRSTNFVEKKRKKKNLSLVKFSALPDYLKDNEYILDYYRCEWPLKYIFLSFFSLHNESLNIWTHFVGFLIFVTITMASLMESAMFHNILLYFFRPSFASPLTTLLLKKPNDSYAFSVAGAQSVDESSTLWLQHVSQRGSSGTNTAILIPKWPWFVFLAGAMGCMTASSLSHLLACHSRSFNLFFWRLDYAGISLMIVCSFFAPIYYAFDCKTEWRLLYLTSISMFGILAIITLLSPALSSPRFRSFRGFLFLVMGFSGAIPATHAVFLHWDHPQILLALGYEILMGVLYALGAVFYLTRIPERWKPGAFDIAGASHQIFHCFVVAGALVHTAATLIIMNWRQGLPLNCASPVAFPT